MNLSLAQIASLVWVFSQVGHSFSFLESSIVRRTTPLHHSKIGDGEAALDDRRSVLGKLAFIPFVTVSTSIASFVDPVSASGGATAGGAYLLSAKQRYNERVKASVEGLVKAAEELKSGNSDVAKAYFLSEGGGGWKDLTAAGYLLSNAFRRNSSAAPDTLPSIKVSVRNDILNALCICVEFHKA
jgi:hypothetical protein